MASIASSKLTLDRIRKRADFLRAQKGRRWRGAALTLEAVASPEPAIKAGTVRVGFTASRKIGGAVERNRAKRRLRAAAATLLPLLGRAGHDYVLIARAATLSRPFACLSTDLAEALKAVHTSLDQEARRRKDTAAR